MPTADKKPKKTVKKSTLPPPLDIGLPKSGLISGKKAMDIVPKSKTLPSASAKPIIVSNRSIVKDPMAPPELTDVPTDPPHQKRKTGTKTVISPLHNTIQPEAATTEAPKKTVLKKTKATATSVVDAPKIEAEKETPTQMAPDLKPAEEPADIPEDPKPAFDEKVVNDIQKSTEPKPEELERTRAEKRAEEAEVLIASKKYVLPINAVKKRQSMRLSWVILILLLGLIVVLGLLDAGVLTFIKAPTDFIQN